jgi:hypothetical protein
MTLRSAPPTTPSISPTTESIRSTDTDHRGFPMFQISQLPVPVDSPTAVSVAPRCADGNGTLTPLFFSDDVIDIARAKAICAKCVLRTNCLADALDRQEPWGVWGGELLAGGRIVRQKRPCGRPPKVPRPELVIDEMGVVGSVA